jgi:Trk K+ transport system NAD-binding subunit
LGSREPFADLGIHALSPAVSGATDIRNFVEDVDFHRDSLLYNLGVELVRVRVKKHLAGVGIEELQETGNLRAAAIIRDHHAMLPSDDSVLQEKDILVAAVHKQDISKLRSYFQLA